MSDESATTAPADALDAPVRSTQGVLLVVALLLLIPLIAVLIAFMPSSGGPGSDVVDALDSDKVHAVYMTNDLVYFGLVDEADGDFFVLKDAFYLRSGAQDGKDGEAESDQLVPVPVSQEVGGDGNLLINANEVTRVQTLADDSEIAKALDITTG